MATPEQIAARVKRKSAKSGFSYEYTGFFDIKPGCAKQLIEGVLKTIGARGPDVRVSYASIGVYDAKYVVFDNDTRLLLNIAFNNDFDKYFDDAFMFLTGGKLEGGTDTSWIDNLKGSPSTGMANTTWEIMKNYLVEHQVTANVYANTTNGTVNEVQKALDLEKVFQQVLNNPEAAKALSHPALKPLLDRAAG